VNFNEKQNPLSVKFLVLNNIINTSNCYKRLLFSLYYYGARWMTSNVHLTKFNINIQSTTDPVFK